MKLIPLATGAPTATNIGADTLVPLSSEANKGTIQNNTAAVVNFNFDAAASPGTLALAAGASYSWDNIVVSIIHLYTAAAQNINGNTSGNIVVELWWE